MNAGRGSGLNIPNASTSRAASNLAAAQPDDVARRVEEARRKVAEAQSRANPYLVSRNHIPSPLSIYFAHLATSQ